MHKRPYGISILFWDTDPLKIRPQAESVSPVGLNPWAENRINQLVLHYTEIQDTMYYHIHSWCVWNNLSCSSLAYQGLHNCYKSFEYGQELLKCFLQLFFHHIQSMLVQLFDKEGLTKLPEP